MPSDSASRTGDRSLLPHRQRGGPPLPRDGERPTNRGIPPRPVLEHDVSTTWMSALPTAGPAQVPSADCPAALVVLVPAVPRPHEAATSSLFVVSPPLCPVKSPKAGISTSPCCPSAPCPSRPRDRCPTRRDACHCGPVWFLVAQLAQRENLICMEY